MATQDLQDFRRELISKLEQEYIKKPEDDAFYYHSSEDRIVLSHAIYWVMSRSVKGKMAKQKFFLLLRQYQEEMLEAYLTEAETFPELLRYCNILYNAIPHLMGAVMSGMSHKEISRFENIYTISAGYAGDMDEDLCYELLDDIDFHFNKVKCRKIEQMVPELVKMGEQLG